MLSDLQGRADTMLGMVSEIEARSPERVAEYRQRLYEKLSEVLSTSGIDEARILTEAALYADKVAVDEETVRLRSHFTEMERILSSDGPAGRKLDFLIQEINRETIQLGQRRMISRRRSLS